ncbi:ferredoxin [Rhodococcus sp. KBS0724]|uniref:ferredoxin n=1 Tax=Rhodococcus sp. KBS0724 TaxID=1179674 RepID=UPI00110EAC0F|nr:ferredoxin [Rhodococcus sp. KBS0724]TSD40226.1 ferredoxin [Rhodococcus sp. KBS0724]
MTPSQKRLHVDPHACEAHALCVEIAPEIFELSDADDVATCDDNPPESKITQVRAAIGGCPRQAISWIEKC